MAYKQTMLAIQQALPKQPDRLLNRSGSEPRADRPCIQTAGLAAIFNQPRSSERHFRGIVWRAFGQSDA